MKNNADPQDACAAKITIPALLPFFLMLNELRHS
jgi:hypothetical protein